MQGKPGEKHQHKRNVLEAAITYLNSDKGRDEVKALTDVIENNPRYDEALFRSKTKGLIGDVVKGMPQTLSPKI
jgi:hypothetical protein